MPPTLSPHSLPLPPGEGRGEGRPTPNAPASPPLPLGEGRGEGNASQWLQWAPVLLGLAALFIPTFIDLFQGVWRDDEQGHGPIVFAISCWLIYRKWPELQAQRNTEPAPVLGWALVTISLFAFWLGRSQAILQFEVGALIPLLAGVTLLVFGRGGLRVIWFPLFFMLFMVPLPGVFVQMLTIPLKTAVSIVSEELLFAVGYPVSRTGVVLQVGQYQLLVADACAGMHTLFTLEALGLLYMNLAGHTSFKRNLALAILIVPISFVANVIRVCVLILVTYHLGDAAGQGYLHGLAGMTLFISALLLMVAIDSLLGRLMKTSASS